MDIVKVISLKKKYVSGKIEVNAINGIDLNIKKGEFLAITGPSGSGKSTLLNIVGGNEFPTEGVVKNLLCAEMLSIWQSALLSAAPSAK